MKTAKTLSKTNMTCSTSSFSTELHKRLQGRSLYIDRESMDMEQLELLINNGLKTEIGLLKPYYDATATARLQMNTKKDKERDAVKEDAEIISRMAWKKLKDSYRYYRMLIVSISNI
jgi:hypothetical protein